MKGPERNHWYFIFSWYCSLYLPLLQFAIFLTVVLLYLSIFKYLVCCFYSLSCMKLIFFLYVFIVQHFFLLYSSPSSLFALFIFPCLLFIKLLEVFWFYLHLREIWLCISVVCVCAYGYEVQRSMSGIFLNHIPHYLETGFLTEQIAHQFT